MKVTNDFSGMEHVQKELEKLNNQSLQIGVFGEDDSFMAMIAGVNEFGMTIHAKKKFMVIPLKKKYAKASPRSFDLFFMKTKEGHAFLCRNVGKDKVEFCYMLVKSVTIPERSFLRSTFDEKEEEWQKFFSKQIDDLIKSASSADSIYERLGAKAASDVQKKIKSISSPSNSPTTVASKGTNNPLINTGRLRQSVTWKVV
ncbi:hypothetical protein ACWOFR_03270 [Carnobacterium gallinarum]|uniref:hypothetical protein n=1 Tax=Carnobacterium gallinarum TaxID=2749 RepID=UPI0005580F73|nr:hypothetical protein [Carnobacterium gallinarum]